MELSKLIHGEKPKWAQLKILDPLKLQAQLLSGELENWDQIAALGDLWQNYMVGGIENLIPNFTDILQEGGITTQDMLQASEQMIKGEIPDDVAQQVYRSAAYQNLIGGGGPGFLHSLQARDLGLTSLDMIKQGAALATTAGNAAQRWQGIAQGTMMNPGSQLYSPQWFAQFRQEQEAAKTANLQHKFNLEAAPDPAWKDRAELLAAYGGMALGGGMGGGGGGGGGGGAYTMGENYGFGGNYQFGMAGGQASGVGGAAGMAMSPWKPGSTDIYFPTEQSYNNYMNVPTGAPPMGYYGGGAPQGFNYTGGTVPPWMI